MSGRPRVCVLGTGAMGGLLGARLARTGARVTLVDRGRRLEALREHGLSLISPEGEREEAGGLRALEHPEEAGEQDVVILGVKAYDLPAVAPRVPTMFGPATVVVTIQNGIPWWYFQRLEGPREGHRISSLDPDGTLERSIPAERLVGCVPYPAAEMVEPGVVHHVEGEKFPLGELDGSESPRVRALADLFEEAGFRSRVLTDLRSEVWLKAWGNLSFNPISALTGATLAGICRHPDTRRLAATMMEEAQAVAEALGASFRVTIERRIRGAEAVGEHRTSMLQDLEAGRPLETAALVGAVVELGGVTGVPTPSIRAVHACLTLLEATRRQGTA